MNSYSDEHKYLQNFIINCQKEINTLKLIIFTSVPIQDLRDA